MGTKTGYLSLHITTFAPHTAPGGSYWADYPPEDLRTELPCRLIYLHPSLIFTLPFLLFFSSFPPLPLFPLSSFFFLPFFLFPLSFPPLTLFPLSSFFFLPFFLLSLSFPPLTLFPLSSFFFLPFFLFPLSFSNLKDDGIEARQALLSVMPWCTPSRTNRLPFSTSQNLIVPYLGLRIRLRIGPLPLHQALPDTFDETVTITALLRGLNEWYASISAAAAPAG